MKESILIFGSGNQAKVTIDIIELSNVYEIAGIIDNKGSGTSLGYPILGTETDLKDINTQNASIRASDRKLFPTQQMLTKGAYYYVRDF